MARATATDSSGSKYITRLHPCAATLVHDYTVFFRNVETNIETSGLRPQAPQPILHTGSKISYKTVRMRDNSKRVVIGASGVEKKNSKSYQSDRE